MLHTLIIDDEAHIRNTLTRMLAKYCPQVEISDEADGVNSGIDSIRSRHPDLVFLDIHLSDDTAFDLLEAFNTIDFRVIFISSFDSRSIQAFKFSGMEYLQKPFNASELKEVVNKVPQMDVKNFQMQLEVLEHNLKNTV